MDGWIVEGMILTAEVGVYRESKGGDWNQPCVRD